MAPHPKPVCLILRPGRRLHWDIPRRTGSMIRLEAGLWRTPTEVPLQIRLTGLGWRPGNVIEPDRRADPGDRLIGAEPLIAGAIEGLHLLADGNPAGSRLARIHGFKGRQVMLAQVSAGVDGEMDTRHVTFVQRRREPRDILPPIEIRADHDPLWIAAHELVEVGEIVRSGHDRLAYLPGEQQP